MSVYTKTQLHAQLYNIQEQKIEILNKSFASVAQVVLQSNDIVRVTFHLIPHLPCFAQRTAFSQCLDVGVCWKFYH